MRDYDELHKLWARAHTFGSPTKFVRNVVVFSELNKLVPGITLDAGCGTGEYSVFLAKRGHKVTAFDPSPFAVRTLLERGGAELGVNVQVNTIEGFFSSLKFDNIVSIEVIEHIEFDQIAVQKSYSLLRKGGIMIASAPGATFLYSEADRLSGHFRRYSRSAFNKLFTRAGFAEVEVKSYGFPVLFVYSILMKILFEKMLIKYFSKDSCGRKSESNLLKKIYPYMLILDQLNITPLGVGYVATCKK
ncbi:MAG: methyltransferase domain-containing protein [Desulfobacteraceae bacterium]|jgi:SAM-dependent methyltransferase|nr:methyltransferase domain-containing protein [Desulfobacteraceae bacterium]